ncbi:palmitoyltransferase ZDHHC20-like [Pseudophryne corroboree]|uniref:palmitoyltransferase ZDHHC20-like n=1 Tax=Pseudophryne corroboree TaxID=495146 RepID=UPI00308163A2
MELSYARRCRRRVARWIPVVFITLGACWGYYAYVFGLCIATVTSHTERVIYLVFFHPLFVMSLVSYWTTLCTRPVKPPKEFCLSEADKELYKEQETQEDKQRVLREAARHLPISTIPEIRYCERCQLLKPDRCHHCSTCDVCVLKQDHHCLALNNCVGYSNYKSFLLLIMYSLLSCLFVSGTTLRFFILTWTDEPQVTERTSDIRVLFCLSTAFSILLLMLFICHCCLLVRNRTTIEFRYGDASSGGDGRPLGFKNFQDVFGQEKRYWLLPVDTSQGDGYSRPSLPDDPEKYAE